MLRAPQRSRYPKVVFPVMMIPNVVFDLFLGHRCDEVLSAVDWYIIPILNPDGYEFSHTADRYT
jgi:hypothetical protein